MRVNYHPKTNKNRITPENRTDLNCNWNRIANTKIHAQKIVNEICKLKNKEQGISGINIHTLINCPSTIIYCLKNIFNAALSTGYFPDQSKTTKIILISKPSKDAKQTDRLISLLEVSGKLLEKSSAIDFSHAFISTIN